MRLLLVFVIFYSMQLEAFHLSICAIFQNEAPYLKEWIEYHRLISVKHFYLEKGIVDLIEWSSPANESCLPHQISAYNHCINRYWTRDERSFHEKKIARRKRFDSFFNEEKFNLYHTELNAECDHAILQYVPELKERLKPTL